MLGVEGNDEEGSENDDDLQKDVVTRGHTRGELRGEASEEELQTVLTV